MTMPTKVTKIFLATQETITPMTLPLFTTSVSAGFPSPADDYIEDLLDLNSHLITNPPATFLVRVSGDSMINAGIHTNDILIVDRSLTPKHNDIVIAILDGEMTVKRIALDNEQVVLVPENDHYKPQQITEEMDFEIWGVVKHVVHSF